MVTLYHLVQVFTWGRGKYGQLGHASVEPEFQPVAVKALADQFVVQVVCGGDHTIAVNSEGEIYSVSFALILVTPLLPWRRAAVVACKRKRVAALFISCVELAICLHHTFQVHLEGFKLTHARCIAKPGPGVQMGSL